MTRKHPSAREAALQALHAQIRQCRRCPLYRTRTQAVPGEGPATSRIMLVGEAPGRQEDLQGRPFVGAAGKFLDTLLSAAGLDRSQVYITNVVKSRPYVGPPPGRNRAPTSEEIAACRPWLDEQVRIIRPAIVVTLGQVALDSFLPGRRLADVHGRPLRAGDRVILPLYHPAMARYGQRWKALLRREFLRVRQLVSGLPTRPRR
ncbi:MAG: uracil-DNA glycosylase [Armatimonadota bacterium]|nr:uracil-DNA glycosylase [Armatimonadota bacterium]MDR7404612.1 uracil-DNA glycosylase [Armatimonadota bacterium]MDR7516668.1 uracil-DNA glycosylase [Armatimonadota bacterium]MDR7587509.1 uracil-DNA glycosylase [Armatimonadota bacterium]MDR7610908.1 uracil-DNA glycosylase [Armatimonadota bacterium]